MRIAWNPTATAVSVSVLAALTVGVTLGTALDDLRAALVLIAVLASAAIGVAVARSLWGASRKVTQILDEELDPDPFNERLRPVYRDQPPTDTTGEPR